MILMAILIALCIVPLSTAPTTFLPLSTAMIVMVASSAATYFVSGRIWALLVFLLCSTAIFMLWLHGKNASMQDHVVPGFLFAVATVVAAVAIASAALSRDTHGEARIYFGGASYLLIGIAFSMVHQRLAIIDPLGYRVPGATEAMPIGRWVDYLWFSFSTLTTSGFTDVVALSSWARLVCTLEAITGVMYPAIFLARLVSAASMEEQESGT